MQFQLPIDIKTLTPPINYQDKIMLMGSCFTEHIGNALSDLKFSVLKNPNGILFGPDAVCHSLNAYISNSPYATTDLFQLNEVWHSWNHHSRYSNISREEGVRIINETQLQAYQFLKSADWLIITLGSSFSYRLTKNADNANKNVDDAVANCHRAPANWFEKKLLDIPSMIAMLENCVDNILNFNPALKIIFTVSPVRHVRDGVEENNRSKARLIETVHHLTEKYTKAYYFPAYELVIDVLRDYRFYDIDLVHPNYAATEFVLDKFAETCINEDSRQLMKEVKSIVIARHHKPFQPQTKAHQQFLISHFEKTKDLQQKYPFLNLKEELIYFSQT